jgi:hypothetical protein
MLQTSIGPLNVPLTDCGGPKHSELEPDSWLANVDEDLDELEKPGYGVELQQPWAAIIRAWSGRF